MALVVAGVVVAAACSGGADDGGTDDRSSAAESTAAEDPGGGGGSAAESTAAEDPGGGGGSAAESGGGSAAEGVLVAAPLRHPATSRPIYFVMPDRFENGDPANDTAGLDPSLGPLVHGFDPTRRGYHHGGDVAGLTERLPYIADLGMEAIWVTPPFRNRYVQGDGTLEGSSSSYHGYWQVDWTQIDPHLGTDEEFVAFVDAAHDLDLHVYLDVVVNHTGDVITYAPRDGESTATAYVSSSAAPYRDADGAEFDPSAVAGSPDFPPLDPAVSFAREPLFADPADATVKAPDWLNDVTLYHNRGNSTFDGESSEWGDFYGLDDLFTEHPRVVEGMIDIHTDIIERYDIDGFRIDTMKHVNIEFWEAFIPAILDAAASLGKDDFYVFGEVLNEDPIAQSAFTNAGVPATLDFIAAGGIERFVAGAGDASLLADAFDSDDWFTDADNNASFQPTFMGNHDGGRMGFLLDRADAAATDETLLQRARIANDLLFLTRGTPVVYYGDEQGFVGEGGDQFARHTMFPSQTEEYLDDDLIGTDATAADSNFDPDHPLYRHIAALAAFRDEHAAFSTGAQLVHPTDGTVFAFSRIDRLERMEYLVLTNSGDVPATVDVTTFTPDATYTSLWGPNASLDADDAGGLSIEVDARDTRVFVADRLVPVPDETAAIEIIRPDDGAVVPTARYRVEAELGDRRLAEVTFSARVDGGDPILLGTDDAAPYRVYWNNEDLADGASVELFATGVDGSGAPVTDSVTVTLGER